MSVRIQQIDVPDRRRVSWASRPTNFDAYTVWRRKERSDAAIRVPVASGAMTRVPRFLQRRFQRNRASASPSIWLLAEWYVI